MTPCSNNLRTASKALEPLEGLAITDTTAGGSYVASSSLIIAATAVAGLVVFV